MIGLADSGKVQFAAWPIELPDTYSAGLQVTRVNSRNGFAITDTL